MSEGDEPVTPARNLDVPTPPSSFEGDDIGGPSSGALPRGLRRHPRPTGALPPIPTRVPSSEGTPPLSLGPSESNDTLVALAGADILRSTTPTPAEKEKNLTHRDKILREILETERTYVSSLTQLINEYLTPLEKVQPGSPLFTLSQKVDLKTIVPSEIKIILQFNTILLEKLVVCVEGVTTGEQVSITTAFEQMPHLLKVYQNYINRYETSLKSFTKCKKNPDFQSFLERTASRIGTDLESLLIRPVQRIPRYVLLLQDLIKHTPNDHPDYAALEPIVTNMRMTCDLINTRKRQAEGRERLWAIHDRLVNYPGQIVLPHRHFISDFVNVQQHIVSEGAAPSDPHTTIMQTLQLHIFNDLLLETVKKGKKLEFFRDIPLPNIGVVFGSDNSLTIKTPGGPDTAFESKYVFDQQADRDQVAKSICATCAEQVISLPQATASLHAQQTGLPSGLVDFAVARIGATAYLFGGHLPATGEWTNQFYRSTVVPGTAELGPWEEIATSPATPSPRSGHSLTAVNGQYLYLFGGFTGTDRLCDLHVFDLASNSWSPETKVQGVVPSARSGHHCVVANDNRRLFFVCGGTTNKLFNDVHIFDVVAKSWTSPQTKVTPQPRFASAVAVYGHQFWLMGGKTFFGNIADVWMFDMNELVWAEMTTVGELPPPMSGHSVAAIGNSLVAYGGNLDLEKAYVFDVEHYVWNTVQLTAAPPSGPFLSRCIEFPECQAALFLSGNAAPGPSVVLSFTKFRAVQKFKKEDSTKRSGIDDPSSSSGASSSSSSLPSAAAAATIAGTTFLLRKVADRAKNLATGSASSSATLVSPREKEAQSGKEDKPAKEKKEKKEKESKSKRLRGFGISKKAAKTEKEPSKDKAKILGAAALPNGPVGPMVGAADIQNALAKRGRGSQVLSRETSAGSLAHSSPSPPHQQAGRSAGPARSTSLQQMRPAGQPAPQQAFGQLSPMRGRGMPMRGGAGLARIPQKQVRPQHVPAFAKIVFRGNAHMIAVQSQSIVQELIDQLPSSPELQLANVVSIVDCDKDLVQIDPTRPLLDFMQHVHGLPIIHISHSAESLSAALSVGHITFKIKTPSTVNTLAFTSLANLVTHLNTSLPIQMVYDDSLVTLLSDSDLLEVLLESKILHNTLPTLFIQP